MNASRLALGFVGVALVGLWYVAGGTTPPATRAAEPPPRVAAPLAHENLTVYFVHGPDAVQGAKVLSLQEALDLNLAVVHETGDVNQLAVENRSPDHELFIQSGDIVKGGQQDRVTQMDMLLPPMSGAVPLPAHCVEQGRWTNRGSEDVARFKSSTKAAVGNEMRLANLSGNQPAVWKSVGVNQGQIATNVGANVNAAASPTSFQLTLESPEVQAKVAAYEAALKAAGEDGDTIIGAVFVVNGRITRAEVYGSNALFRKAWAKQLNSMAVEAIQLRTEKPTAQAPSVREVEKFLAHASDPEPARATTAANLSDEDPAVVAMREMASLTRRIREDDRLSTRERFFVTEINDNIGVPHTPAPDSTIMGGSGAGRVQIQGATISGNGAAPDHRQLHNFSVGAFGENQARGAVATNPDGNRLSSNVAANRSTVTVEARDATRKNAVIHKSYIKR